MNRAHGMHVDLKQIKTCQKFSKVIYSFYASERFYILNASKNATFTV